MKKIPYLLRRTHYALRQSLNTALAKYDLTASQYEIIAQLSNCDCLEHRELLDVLNIASPTLTKHMNLLEDAGYIVREVSEHDARVRVVALTDKGQSVQTAIEDQFPAVIEQLLYDFSPAERLLLTELLERLTGNAEELNRP